MSRKRRASAVVGVHRNGGGVGGQQKKWQKTLPRECGEEGDRRSRRETAVDVK